MSLPRACPICNSQLKELVFKQFFSGFSEGGLFDGYTVVVCKTCGFSFADDIPLQDTFDVYYKEMSKYENEYVCGKASSTSISTYKAILDASSPFLPDKSARILDIGCATGALLYEFKKSGYQNVVGLDPSPSCTRTGLELYGINILNCALSEVPAYQQPFDFLILNSVLEHIRDIRESIMALRLLLKPDGLIWIEVPDVQRFPNFVSVAFQQFSMEHINFFSSKSLINLMESCGFKSISTWQNERQLESIIDPALSTIFQVSQTPITTQLSRDDLSFPALVEYIDISSQVEHGVLEKIAQIEQSGKPIIIWGVGTHTQRLLATSRLGKAKIRVFVDSNKRYYDKMMNGIPIIAPELLFDMDEPILISSRLYQEEIADQIRQKFNLPNEIIRLY